VSFAIQVIASKKSKETQHDIAQWSRALESARTSLKIADIDSASLEHIALSSQSPDKFTVVTRLIYQYGKSHPNGDQISMIFFNRVNTSPFDLSDWLEAVNYFYDWLVKNKRKIDFLSMVKYLECCAESPDAKEQGQTLTGLVENMLDVCGYEAG
jgi:hypothetical protein